MVALKEKLGRKIQQIRKSKNLTQEKLAEAIGLDTPNLSNIERGKRFVSADTLEKIASALNVNEKELFNFEYFLPKDDVIEKINTILDNSTEKEVQYYYRMIIDYLESCK